MALLDNGVQINTIMPSFVEECPQCGAFVGLSRWTSCLCRLRQCIDLTFRLHNHTGSSVDGVQGYDEDQIAMAIMDLSNFAM